MIILFIIIVNYNACSQTNDKELIRDFEREFMNNPNFEIENIDTYLDINNESPAGRKKILNLVTQHIRDCQAFSQITSTSYENLEIFHYAEVAKNSKISASSLYNQLDYPNKDEVFYVIYNNDPDLLSLIIVKDHKIISLYPELHQGTEPVKPFLLNSKSF